MILLYNHYYPTKIRLIITLFLATDYTDFTDFIRVNQFNRLNQWQL
jgi:hypothetical protein